MKFCFAVTISLFSLFLVSCDSPLEKAKKEVRAKYADDDPALLEKIPIEEENITLQKAGSESVHVAGGKNFRAFAPK